MRISTRPIVSAPAAGNISQLADACDAGAVTRPQRRARGPEFDLAAYQDLIPALWPVLRPATRSLASAAKLCPTPSPAAGVGASRLDRVLDNQDTPHMDACAIFSAIGRTLQLIAAIPAWHVGAFLTASGGLNAPFCAATGESPADVDFLQRKAATCVLPVTAPDYALLSPSPLWLWAPQRLYPHSRIHDAPHRGIMPVIKDQITTLRRHNGLIM
jgi:hypothetical protein